MMVLKRKFSMFGVVFLVVFVVGVMQLHEINDAYFFLVASDVMYEVMEKFAQFDNALNALIARRGSRQNQECKEYS